MELFIKNEHKSLYKTIKVNIAITNFNNSLCGAILYLMLGLYALPLYASLLRITNVIGDLYRCKLQNKLVENKIQYLNTQYLKMQFYETIISVVGYTIILISIKLAVLILLISILLSAVTRAYFISYTAKIDDILTSSQVVMRTKYYAVLDKVANVSSIIGTCINSSIFYIASKYNISNIKVYKTLAIVFACGKIIDLICSILEAKKVRKLYVQKNRREK